MKFLLFLFLFIPAICYAQYTETVTITPDLHKMEVQRSQINTGTPAYPVFEDRYSTETPDATGNAYVGKQDDEPDYQNTFRMIYGFDLSGIPARSAGRGFEPRRGANEPMVHEHNVQVQLAFNTLTLYRSSGLHTPLFHLLDARDIRTDPDDQV